MNLNGYEKYGPQKFRWATWMEGRQGGEWFSNYTQNNINLI